MKTNNTFHTALYLRLSREDGDKEESDSIENQRKMLTSFIRQGKEFVYYDEYVDDGYSGTNFQRPSFKRLIGDIESGYVNCIIVKDLSRFGRDYIDMGYYLERFFVSKNIRFIAINDGIDSFLKEYDMLLPVRNVFNEQYARDISKKVQSSFKVKQKEGEFIGAFACYGYQKNNADKHKLIIDEYAASIVRRIFQLFIEGKGKIAIARILNEEGILCPSEYKKACGYRYCNANKLNKTTYWTYSTIHKMLSNQMYIGNMVQGKSTRRMKGKSIPLKEEEWIVVQDTHQAIIDMDTWEKVQILMIKETKQINFSQNISIFAGFLKCGDCGRALAKKSASNGTVWYYCSSYTRYGKAQCTPHKIRHGDLEEIVLGDLNNILHTTKDLKLLIEKEKKKTLKNKEDLFHELAKWQADLIRIQKIKKEAYEDYKDNLLSKKEYLEFKEDYQKKENLLESKIKIVQEKQRATSKEGLAESVWIKELCQSNYIARLDRSIVADMIDCIQVYEENRIKIVYNFSQKNCKISSFHQSQNNTIS